MTTESKTRVAGAESSRKLLQVLLLFTPDTPTWTVGGIGEKLGLTQSMVYRYVALLREVGLLDSAGGKSYRVTDAARLLAKAAIAARPPIGELTKPYVTALRDRFNETAYVTRISAWSGYIIELAQTFHPVQLKFEEGQAVILHTGTSGRLFLAAMSKADRAKYFEMNGVDRTVFHPHLLSDEALDALNARGAAEGDDEVGDGIWGYVAGIHDGDELVASIGMAAPKFRITDAQRSEMRQMVEATAAEISAKLRVS